MLAYDKIASCPSVSDKELEDAADNFGADIRRTARVICEFLPECAYTSRRITLLVHWTTKGNCICRHHHDHRCLKKHDSPVAFWGVAYLRQLNRAKDDCIGSKPLHMHCGCLIEHVLFDFWFWKMSAARSSHPNLNQQLWNMGKESTPPTIRAFWVSQFKAMTNLTLDDLYSLGPDSDATVDHFSMMVARSILRSAYTLSTQLSIGLNLAFETSEDKERFHKVANFL